ncbi:nucleolar complex protein 14 [[Candida] anglica]|uniref:Nucleolar complex protein 14 n=1 Tax=[Candida] anglica TaxID=148631 RepID=A0ABP0E9V9_9ASCO
MAGSQLKQLKAVLKTNGFTGQSNVKKTNKKGRTSTEIKRDDKKEILSGIRQQFNKFDTKTNRTKRDVTIIQGGKFVKAGSAQHNKATQSRTMAEQSLRVEYNAKKARNGRTGGVVDRRFGESNKNMTSEEKMLERFTKERERQSKKNIFSLDDDDEENDEDDDGFVLTHYGKSLALEDDGKDGKKRGFESDEDEELMPNSVDEQPNRKKSKAEVMKEVMAKSKFYKQQRQQEHQKALDDIMDLDEDFDDVMQDLNSTQVKLPKKQFSTKKPEEIEYDNKVRELTYDRRSVPADRTKTEEELAKEHEEKMKKLETDRLNRMNGLDESRATEGDDLDDDFWRGSDDEEGENVEGSGSEEENSSGSEDEETSATSGRPSSRKQISVSMPSTYEEFATSLETVEPKKQSAYVDKIIEVYQPRLASGNKEKMGVFIGILFEHVLKLSDEQNEEHKIIIESFVKKLKKLAEKYNEPLVATIREKILEIQERIISNEVQVSDLVFYTLVGYLFSTSDHYHLVVTPTLILMNETLTNIQYNKDITFEQVCQGIFISDVLINYTNFSKRFIPEVVNALERFLLALVPEPLSIVSKEELTTEVVNTKVNLSKSSSKSKPVSNDDKISLHIMKKPSVTNEDKLRLTHRLLVVLDKFSDIWKEHNSLPEILAPFKIILKHLVKYYGTQLPKLAQLLNKIVKLEENAIKDRKPLTLQHHKALAIATFAPKFEENFNPDKKSYDVNRERQEIGKMKAQLKKEKKSAIKDIRKETRFVAREQIQEKKTMYDAYHKKMANIVNSISTIEGAEKNQYEKEKQQRKKR